MDRAFLDGYWAGQGDPSGGTRPRLRGSPSYADLERKVDALTRALADALQEIEKKGAELDVASKHKSEFLANMSHELRTPLNAVIGFSEVLLDRMVGDLNQKQEECLQDIVDSGRHLLLLVNDILDLSKVEADRTDPELTHFGLPEAIDDAVTTVRAERTAPLSLVPAASPAQIAAAGARPATVLVIEDDQRALNLLRMHLEGAGYEVATADDAEQGLELARTLRPHAITLDIKLPGMDGWTFLARAQGDPAIADIPIIVVSMVDERARGLALGAVDYLVKPVGRESLLAALRTLPAA